MSETDTKKTTSQDQEVSQTLHLHFLVWNITIMTTVKRLSLKFKPSVYCEVQPEISSERVDLRKKIWWDWSLLEVNFSKRPGLGRVAYIMDLFRHFVLFWQCVEKKCFYCIGMWHWLWTKTGMVNLLNFELNFNGFDF